MTKEDRSAMILRFLDESGLALPPKAIFVNLRRSKNITFSLRTVRRHLPELADRGLLGTLDDETGYYYITDAGREWLDNYENGD